MNGYTKADNWLWDYVMPRAKPNTFKVVSAVVRMTTGWHRTEVELTFDDLQEITGIIGRSTLNRAIEDALTQGFIGRKESGKSYLYSPKIVSCDSPKIVPETSTEMVLPEEEPVPKQDYHQYQNGTDTSTKMVLSTSGTKEKKETKKRESDDSLPAQKTNGNSHNHNHIKAELEKTFSSCSGLPIPKRKTAKQCKAAAVRWWNPLMEMFELTGDLDTTKYYITTVVQQMRQDGLTVSAPQSIENNVLDFHARSQGGGGVVISNQVQRAPDGGFNL